MDVVVESIVVEENAGLRAEAPRGLPLVVVMSGISDAGSVVSQLAEYFLEHSDPQPIFRFDPDLLLDYRSRRPLMTFDSDHFEDYVPEELTLSLATDVLGSPFLLLQGYEPDFRWEQWVDVMLAVVEEFEVSTTSWVHALPMPVPHSRPLAATVSGSREDLVEQHSLWRPTTRLSATAAHLLEYRLFNLGENVVGFAILIPHYLAGNEYPEGLCAALDYLMAATGRLFAVEELRERAAEFRQQVDQQIAENDESLEMVRNLERRYDDFVRQSEAEDADLSSGGFGDLPTAEQLASELEKFLAERQVDDGDDASSASDEP